MTSPWSIRHSRRLLPLVAMVAAMGAGCGGGAEADVEVTVTRAQSDTSALMAVCDPAFTGACAEVADAFAQAGSRTSVKVGVFVDAQVSRIGLELFTNNPPSCNRLALDVPHDPIEVTLPATVGGSLGTDCGDCQMLGCVDAGPLPPEGLEE